MYFLSSRSELYNFHFSIFVFILVILRVTATLTLCFGCLLSSRYLHINLLTNLLHAPTSFFDTTPIGRIINRFGKDVEIVDNALPMLFLSFINCLFTVKYFSLFIFVLFSYNEGVTSFPLLLSAQLKCYVFI